MNKIIEKRINLRLMGLISLIIFVSIALLAIVHYKLNIKDSRRMARKYLTAISEGVSDTVDSWLLEKRKLIEMVCESDSLKKHLETGDPGIKRFAVDLNKKMGDYEAVFWADKNAIIVYDSHDFESSSGVDLTTRPYWKQFEENNFAFTFYPWIERSPTTRKLVFVMIMAVRDNRDSIVGFFGTAIDWGKFIDRFLLPVKVGQTGYVAITDLHGRNIGHPDRSLNLRDLSQNLWMQKMIAEKNGFQRYVFRGTSKFMAYIQSRQSGWIVNTSIDEKELIQGAIYTRNLVLLICVILLVLLLLVVGYLDVFRLNRAQHELKASERKFRLIFNRGNDGIFVHTLDRNGTPGEFVEVNRNFLNLMHVKRREVLGSPSMDLIGSSCACDYPKVMRQIIETKYQSLETEISTRDNDVLNIEFRLFLMESGRKYAVMGFVRDITHRIQTRKALRRSRDQLDRMVRARTRELEEANLNLKMQCETTGKMAVALKESEEKYRSLVERANDGILLVEDGRIVFANEKLAQMAGISWDELIGLPLEKILAPGEYARIEQSFRQRLTNLQKNEILETRLDIGGSRSLFVEINAGLVEYEGKPADFIFVRDITDRKRAEEERRRTQEQLIQTDKLAALGTLVSGVAHEINNPNNSIMLNAPVLAEAWEGVLPVFESYQEKHGDFLIAGMPFSLFREYVADIVDDIITSAHRIKGIVEDLKNFARPGQTDINADLSVNELVRSSIKLISNLIMKSTDHFNISYGQDLPRVRGNFHRLEQVIVNLMQNACQALPDRSRGITISTSYISDTHEVQIEVQDEGEGISRENMKQIMNPFFTTKRGRGGTGLGLSVSQSLVKEHQGELIFESTPGKGTTARVRLPGIEKNSEE